MSAAASHIVHRERSSQARLIAALCGLVAAAFIASLFVGYAGLDAPQALADALRGANTLPAIVLVELRLPRALLGCFVGFSLGLAGAAMQGFLRNPLAEPGVVGVSGAAAFGAVVAFYSGLSHLLPLALPVGAIGGAMLAALLLYALVGRGVHLVEHAQSTLRTADFLDAGTGRSHMNKADEQHRQGEQEAHEISADRGSRPLDATPGRRFPEPA